MIATPAILNTLRFIDTSNLNSGFDGNYYRNQLLDYQTGKCYAQKLKKSDTLTLQLIVDSSTSPSVPPDLEFYNESNLLYLSIPWQLNPLVIAVNTDLKIYEIIYSLAGFVSGAYVAQFDVFTTETLSIEDQQDYTTLLKYKNKENNYDVVFDTGIEFQFRVESWVEYETTENERAVYADQVRNLTQLSSVAFRKHNFYVGFEVGVPNWILDKVVHIQQCDQVSYNGIYYQVPAEEQFEYEKNPDNNYIGGKIVIHPSENNFTKYTTQPGQSGTTFTPVQKTNQYLGVIAPLTVNGLFKLASVLEYVAILKIGADYVLNIGITPNGNEIGQFIVDSQENSFEVQYVFRNATPVYFSGTGINADELYLVWKQLNEIPVPIGGGNVPPPVGIGAKMLYEEVNPGDFALDFDQTTGLGDSNRDWRGWAIAGTNGRVHMENAYPIGWDRVDSNDIGTTIGANLKAIPKAALPAEGIATLSVTVNSSPGDIPDANNPVARAGSNNGAFAYELRKGAGAATLGKSANLGDGANFDVRPNSIVSVWVVKIA